MKRKYWLVVLILTMLVCSFASASVLKPGGYVGPDASWLQKSDRLMSIYSGQLSFWSNYTLTVPLSIPKEGLYKILISASGSPALDPFGNKWPIMKLKVANREICTWLVDDQKKLFVSNAIKLPQGNHDAQISMINDYNNGREDRNLFIFGLALASVKTEDAKPMVMFDGKPAAVWGEFVEGTKAVVVKTNVDPFYPAKRAIADYTPTTTAPSEIGVRLKNGLEYNLADFTVEESLDGQWKISGLTKSQEPFPEDVDLDKGYWQGNFNDSAWDTIGVPLDWYEKYPEARDGDAPYVKGWYRRGIDIPQAQRGKRVTLHFGVIGYEATLFVNGKRVGSHHGDFTPWDIDITDYVRFGERNTLAIRVLSDFGNWTVENERLADHAHGSQWHYTNVKGGIWQSAKVRYEEPIRITRMLISPRFAKKTIEVDYVIENHSGEKKYLNLHGVVRSAMKGDSSEVANGELDKLCLTPGTFEGRVEVPLENPQLWSPDNPYLYYLSLALGDDEKLATAKTQRFGFREFKAEGNHFYLNGERIYLFGENIPSVHYGGYEASQEEEMRRIAKIMVGHKRQGYNMLRNAHHPIVPYALELADEIGMMIYDEWAWCFTWEIDPEKFEQRNLPELKEFIYRDYNYPSVVMWSTGNEVHFSKRPYVQEQFIKQVRLVRELDRSGRPVSVFSGASYGYGFEKLETDFLDYHSYEGIGSPAWTKLEDSLDTIYNINAETYGENGKLEMPYVIWEVLGFSWGDSSDPSFTLNDIDKYAEYANRDTQWAIPNGIGFAGTLGLAAATDPERGLRYGREHYGKRMMEFIRYRHDQVQGFAPWFQDPDTYAAPLWNQPLYVGLRDSKGVPLRNLFAGRDYQQNLFLVNSQERDFATLDLKLTLVGLDDSKREISNISLLGIKPWEKKEQAITIPIPADTKPGSYQLRVVVLENGNEVSRNFYDLSIQGQDVLTAKLPTEKKIAVLKPNSADGNNLIQILADLEIGVTEISNLETIANYDVVVIPPTDKPYTLFENHDNAVKLMSWVGTGGILLQLEQNYFGQAPTGQSLVLAENTFVDVAIPAHPAFSGLYQSNFDTWNNPNFGYSIYYGLAPFNTNALAVRGPFLGRTDISNAVSEGSYGNGRIFTSQLAATSLWDLDSAATMYLKNVLQYMLVDSTVYEDVREWVTDSTGYIIAKERVQSIDLRAYANRSFTDDVEGDQKGGWADQGINDFRTMPLGSQTLLGIPFEIIDPKTNNDRSCIVLGGADRQYFPQSVEGIAVNQYFSRLFFLHTSAWTKNEAMGEYRVKYEDGSVEKIVLTGGVNIGDWWFPNDWPGAKVALTKQNPLNQLVGLWALVWDNPKPDQKITAIDFVSYGNAVPILVAISGEKATLDPLLIDDFETEKEWTAMATGEHPEPTAERINKQSEPENVWAGDWALKIKMPAKQDSGVPVVFTKFPLDKIKEGNSYSYLTFWIKASNFGKLSVGLPKDDWSEGLWYDLTFRPGEWQKVRLHLGEDMGLKNMNWTLEQIRGELFFYGMRDEAIIYLDGIKLE